MRKVFSATFVVAALVFSGGCDLLKNGSSISPSPGPGPGPDPGAQYEKLPAMHPILDENGNETKMRVELSGEPVPARGSMVSLGVPTGPPDCVKGQCFQFPEGIRMFFDGTANPWTGAKFTARFSEDGETPCNVNPIFTLWAGPIDLEGSTVFGTNGVYKTFQEGCIPKYLLVEAEYRSTATGGPGQSGKAKPFFLDWRPR